MIPWIRLPFQHRNTKAMLMLRAECGWEGYGVYVAMLQAAMESHEHRLTSDEHLLSMCLAVDEQLLRRVVAVLNSVERVINDTDSLMLTEVDQALNEYASLRQKRSEAGKISAQKRSGQSNKRSTRVQHKSTPVEQRSTHNNTIHNNTIHSKSNTPLTPQWGDLTEPMQKWIRFRKELKKPLTQSSIDQLVKTYSGQTLRFSEAVAFTIGKGWQGLKHPDELGQLNGNNQPRLTPAQEMLKLAAELEEKNL